MKALKLILSITLLMTGLIVKGQIQEYVIEASDSLITRGVLQIDADKFKATTQVSSDDTTLVSLDYLTNLLDNAEYADSLAFHSNTGYLVYYRQGVALDSTSMDGRYLTAEVDGSVTNELQNLSLGTTTTTTQPVNISSGTGVTLPAATTTTAGLMTSTDKSKLDNIEANANNYNHPTGFTDQPTTALTGASVISQIDVTSEGHVQGVSTRALSAADIGAEATQTKGNLTESVTGLEFSATRQVNGGAADLSLTAGYEIPTTTSINNWNTAYTNRITSLTTTGNSGAATLVSNVLNIPNYTLAGLGYSYPGAGIPISTGTGWGTSITNNSANWNTAYGWGNHAGLYHLKSNSPQADPNAVLTQSSYRFDPNVNNPTNQHYSIITYGNGGNVTGQLATHYTTGQSYTRSYNSSWSAWRKLYDDGNFIAGTHYQAPLTNPVTGTGTTNYLPKWTGLSSLGNSQIQDNGTLTSIGGTPTVHKLTVYDTGANNFALDSPIPTQRFRVSGVDKWAFLINYGGTDQFSLYDYTKGDIVWAWKANGNAYFNSGNFGIGTTAPTQKLDVNGNARFRSIGTTTTSTVLGVTSDGTLTTNVSITGGATWKGGWNASTNTPALSDATGTNGWWYKVTVAGTQNLGSGSITFAVGDDVIHNGSVWQKFSVSISESDPVFVASDVYNITTADSTNWSTAYSWGNHASAGYLTAEVDGSVTNEGSLTVGAGTATTSVINSNTSGSTPVTLSVDGTNLGISEVGNTISLSNLKPDQTVSLTGSGSTSVTGTYPNFTISSTDNNTTYTGSAGVQLVGNDFRMNIGSLTTGAISASTHYIPWYQTTGAHWRTTLAELQAVAGYNAGKIQNVTVSSTAPTTDYVLKYNGTTWAPAPDATGAGALTSGDAINVTGDSINYKPTRITATMTDLNMLNNAASIVTNFEYGGAIYRTTLGQLSDLGLYNARELRGYTIASATPSTGEVLKWTGTQWEPEPDATGGMTDPMTTRGDIIYRNSSNVTARLGRGTAGQLLYSNGTDLSWRTPLKADIGLANVENTALSTWTGSTNISTVGSITQGNWNADPIGVTKGGTGKTSYTAYALLAGGTTSTGTLQQVAGVGTAGQVLTSNGAGALPTWQANSAGGWVDNGTDVVLSNTSDNVAIGASSAGTGNKLLVNGNIYTSSLFVSSYITFNQLSGYLGSSGNPWLYTMASDDGLIYQKGSSFDNYRYHLTSKIQPVTSSTATISYSTGDLAQDTLTANTTYNITYIPDGAEGEIFVRQDGTGGWTLTLNMYPLSTSSTALTKVTVGATTAIKTTANKHTLIRYRRWGTKVTIEYLQEP